MRIGRPRFLLRSAAAAGAGLVFASLSLSPMGRDFTRTYGSANSALHVYRFFNCYMVASRPAGYDAWQDEGIDVTRLSWEPPSDESSLLSLVFDAIALDLGDDSSALSGIDVSLPWYGIQLVPWKGSRALLVEPRKLRWFTLALTAPLALGLIRADVRRRRQRRGACMLCGYSLFGCPSPRCPECGDSVVPFNARPAPAPVETGAS